MNILTGFFRLIHLEEKGDSVLFLLSSQPERKKAIPGNGNQIRQFWARMPKNKFETVKEKNKLHDLAAKEYVSVFGHIGSIVVRDQLKGIEKPYPQVMLSNIERAVFVREEPPRERYSNRVLISGYVKFVQPISEEDAIDIKKPVYAVVQVGGYREIIATEKNVRTSDTIQVALFRGAKDVILKAQMQNEANGYGFIFQGNATGVRTFEDVQIKGSDIFKKKSRYYPVISFTQAEPTHVLPERMFDITEEN